MTLYKIVDTNDGISVAHIEPAEEAAIVRPEANDSRVRVSVCWTVWIENNNALGWGPVDERTEYSVGQITEADSFNTDKTVASGAGLHAFEKRQDAIKWKEQADI